MVALQPLWAKVKMLILKAVLLIKVTYPQNLSWAEPGRWDKSLSLLPRLNAEQQVKAKEAKASARGSRSVVGMAVSFSVGYTGHGRARAAQCPRSPSLWVPGSLWGVEPGTKAPPAPEPWAEEHRSMVGQIYC